MKKQILLAVALVIGSQEVLAEWVELGVNGSGDATVYVDQATIRKTTDSVRMWGLIDFKRPMLLAKSAPYLSLKLQTEYDCKNEQTRTLSASFHSEHQGGGRVVNTSASADQWEPVPPESTIEVYGNLSATRNSLEKFATLPG